MASLIKKLKKGIPYYYVVESKRINGKPRIVEQHYLGTADKIFKTCQKKSAPIAQEVALTRIGPLALWDVACSAKLPEMIDAAFPKRDQSASLSHYLLLAAFARAFHPCSKSKIGQWYVGSGWGQGQDGGSGWGHTLISDYIVDSKRQFYYLVGGQDGVTPGVLKIG